MKRLLVDHLKNIIGWRTRRRLLVFCVDDYGSIRLQSRATREIIQNSGLKLASRFDRQDSIETREDLEALFEVLSSFRDHNGRSPQFTAYTLCANPDFEGILERGCYSYKRLPETFQRLSETNPRAYQGTWELWLQGIKDRLIYPQFHGREHLNVALLEEKLKRRSQDLYTNLEHESLVALKAEACMPGVEFTHAFAWSCKQDLDSQGEILLDGLKLFQEIFGFVSRTFTPPAQILHPKLHSLALQGGVLAIDRPLRDRVPPGARGPKREMNFLGASSRNSPLKFVRNVVFEPGSRPDSSSVSRAIDMISAAFYWNKPAIVSSHRVNFSGHIEPANRKQGLLALRTLLTEILRRWPDVEFITANQLCMMMLEEYGPNSVGAC